MAELVYSTYREIKNEKGKTLIRCKQCNSWVLEKNMNKHKRKCDIKFSNNGKSSN